VKSKTYAFYAGLAYCPKKCLEAWNCGGGQNLTNFGEVTHFNNALTLAAGYIGYEKVTNQIIVSFRGSANIENWIEDFTFEKTSYSCKGCEIHLGFLEDYKIVEEQINGAVQKLIQKHPSASILTTGHSLGGALAEIGGMRLKAKFNKKVEVHHFGGPRIGNTAMAQYLGTRVDTLYRVVHNKDIVPHLPFEWMEYHHSAFEVFWDEHFTNYTICDASGEDSKCSNQFYPDYSPADHGIYFMVLDDLKC
jgi:predicted lipase